MNAYKKILKGGWTAGKRQKGPTNRHLRRVHSIETKNLLETSDSTESERLSIKSEIQEDEYILSEHLYDFDKKEKPTKKKKKNLSQKQIKSKIDHLERKLKVLNWSYHSSETTERLRSYYTDDLKKLNAQLKPEEKKS